MQAERPSLEVRAQEVRDAGFSHSLSLSVAYQGAGFSGFARQPDERLMTVQGELEKALALLFKRDIKTVCAGRTDAGVHARGQVVSFDVFPHELEGRSLARLQRSLQALTPETLAVQRVDERPLGFSARFDALWREYHYHLSTQAVPPVLIAPLVWDLGNHPLDLAAMNEAATHFIGEKDFRSFCLTASAVGKSTVRCLHEVEVYSEEVLGMPVVTVRVLGSAFLHSMVRTMVGTLVAVGRGRKSPVWISEVIEASSREAAGETAPAQGLIFWDVGYPVECAPLESGAN